MSSEKESQEYIKNRNFLCDLLGKFKLKDGRTIEILTWNRNQYKLENPLSATIARIRITPSENPKEILKVTYDEVLELLGKVRYVYKGKGKGKEKEKEKETI